MQTQILLSESYEQNKTKYEKGNHIVAISMTMSPSKALQYLKGISSRLFFKFHPKARLRYPDGNLWSRGKFAASLGFVQIEVVNEYVRNQDTHHGTVFAI